MLCTVCAINLIYLNIFYFLFNPINILTSLNILTINKKALHNNSLKSSNRNIKYIFNKQNT